MYTDKQEMINRFGERELIQLTDADGSAGEIVDAVLDKAIADAVAEINSYLAVRYKLPLPQVPAVIARIASDIARWHLYDDHAPDDVRKRYEDVVKMLQQIRDGKLTLGLDEVIDGQGAGDVQIDAPQSVFDRNDLKDFG